MPGIFDESKHPRDDSGKWIKVGDLKKATYDYATQDKLRARVTDPAERAKLEQHIQGEHGIGPEHYTPEPPPEMMPEDTGGFPGEGHEVEPEGAKPPAPAAPAAPKAPTPPAGAADAAAGVGGAKIHELADWIRRDFRGRGKPIPYALKPYLDALLSMNDIGDMYGDDPGHHVVAYALGNMRGLQTATGKAAKAELSKRLKAHTKSGGGRYARYGSEAPAGAPGAKMSRDAGINSAWGFNATQNGDGSLTVHDVPVFVTCQRGKYEFDEKWLDAALSRAKQAEGDGYLPPLHVRHHGRDSVTPAGVFRATNKKMVRFKGGIRPAIIADLIITNPEVVADVMAKRLPYRSVEIFDVDKPNLDSLALLDHEAPFLELPMLVVREVTGSAEAPVSPETFSMERSNAGDGLVCFFRRGHRAHVLMEANATMPDDAKKSESKSESKSSGGIDVAAVVAAISDGSISIADFAAIKDAMASAESMAPGAGAAPVTPEPEMPEMDEESDMDEKPEMTGAAPASAPATAMRRGVDPVEFARVKATADAAQAEIMALKNERKREADVTAACDTLKDRALGADLRDRLLKFHAEHGGKAFSAYVDGLAASAPRITAGDDRKAGDFASARSTIPALALKFQKDGPEAVEKAARFSREWEALYAAGHTRMSQERYVEINMAGGPTAIVK